AAARSPARRRRAASATARARGRSSAGVADSRRSSFWFRLLIALISFFVRRSIVLRSPLRRLVVASHRFFVDLGAGKSDGKARGKAKEGARELRKRNRRRDYQRRSKNDRRAMKQAMNGAIKQVTIAVKMHRCTAA